MARRMVRDEEGEEQSHALAESLVTSIKKACGEDSAVLMKDLEDTTTSEVKLWVPTGFRWLDMVMSQGRGLPCGKVIELYGLEGTCKTAFCQFMIKHYQRMGGAAVYLDFETSLDKNHLIGYGLDMGSLAYVNVDTMEDGFDAVLNVLRTLAEEKNDKPVLIVWDSVAMSPPRAEADEKSHDQSHVGLMARSLSKGCRKIRRIIAKTNCTMLFTNQARVDIGVMYGDKLTVPGGKALRFASSIRLKFSRVKTLRVKKKGFDKPVGYIIEADIKKTRFAPPHQKAQFILTFKNGPDPDASMIHYLKEIGLVRKVGGSMTFGPMKEIVSAKNWKEFYKNNRKEVEKHIRAREDELFMSDDLDSVEENSNSE